MAGHWLGRGPDAAVAQLFDGERPVVARARSSTPPLCSPAPLLPLGRSSCRRRAAIKALLDASAVARHPFRKQVGELSMDALLAAFGPLLVVAGGAEGVGQALGKVGGAGTAVVAAVVAEAKEGAAALLGALLLVWRYEISGDVVEFDDGMGRPRAFRFALECDCLSLREQESGTVVEYRREQ